MRAFAGVHYVRHQHCVVSRPEPDAAARQHQPIALDIVAYFDNALVFKNRLERIECLALRDLPAQSLAANSPDVSPSLASR